MNRMSHHNASKDQSKTDHEYSKNTPIVEVTFFRCHLMPSTGTDSKHDVWSRCSEIHQRSNHGSIEIKCDKDDTKSQTGYVFVINGGAVDWKSKKQTTIAMHSAQAEYVAASEAAMEAVWIRKFVGDLGVMPSINKPINMYCDNSAAIIFANEPGIMKGARHFLRRYHYALPRGMVIDHAKGIGLQLASSFMHTLHQLDTFYNALNPNDQDALDSAAGGKFLDKIPRECLSIIESKSKVRYSRSRVTDVRANANALPPSSSHLNSFNLQQIAASLEDKLDIRMNRFEKSLNDMKNSFITPTAPLKAVEEVCVTYGANHGYNQCPLTRGNDFPVFHDNIQQFQTAAVGNFFQNRNQNVSNQMRPPGFNQPTHQNNNQNRFQGNNFNQNQNRQNNQGVVYQNRAQQNPNFQAPSQQNTVTQGKFEAYCNAPLRKKTLCHNLGVISKHS
nr:putative retrotransposon protein [Tanacetum cinerariifolium]